MNDSPHIHSKLAEGISHLGLNLPVEPFLQYLSLLSKWNQAYNLTAVREIDTMVSRHVLDSLAILPWIKGTRVLDVGSGAGLPGIPLAIALPHLSVVLLDSNGKKIRFLQEVKRALVLNNVEIVHARVENYHPGYGFDTVTSRAFSELAQMIRLTHHLVAEKGIWLAMKGQIQELELERIPHPYQIEAYSIAGVERCCVIISMD